MGNGERGMRSTIFHKIFQSEQFESAEFIDDNSFLWFLTPVHVGTCHLLGQYFGWRTTNASILMKFRTLHKSRAVNSMVAIVFCNFWRLSILTPVNVGTCHLLGHSFGRKTANAWILMKLCMLHKSKALSSMVTTVFVVFDAHLSNSTPVNFGIVNSLSLKF